MSAGRVVNAENPSARRKAECDLDRYPFPDSRQAIARVLASFITDDGCMVWVSALKLAHRAGVSENTAQRALVDFDHTGLTVRVPDFVFPDDTDNEARKHTHRIARRVNMQRLPELYPGNIGWDEFRERNRAKQQKCDKKRKSITPPCGNSAPGETRQLPHGAGSVTPNGAIDYPTEGVQLPHENPSITPPRGTSVLERLQSVLPERSLSGAHGRAGSVDFAARSSTARPITNGANNGTATATGGALFDTFEKFRRSGQCTWPKKSGSRASIHAEFAKLEACGATAATMHEALTIAQRKLARSGHQPGPKSVLDALRKLMGTNDPIPDYSVPEARRS